MSDKDDNRSRGQDGTKREGAVWQYLLLYLFRLIIILVLAFIALSALGFAMRYFNYPIPVISNDVIDALMDKIMGDDSSPTSLPQFH